MLILMKKRLISVFLSGESDIRNGIYWRPTTQQFARAPQQFARTHQQFARTHQQFERTHQQLAIDRGDSAKISEMPATLAILFLKPRNPTAPMYFDSTIYKVTMVAKPCTAATKA